MTNMDLAKYIFEEQSKFSEKRQNKESSNFFEPEILKNYKIPEFHVKPTHKKKCQDEMFSKVLAFIEHVKYIRSSEFCTIMPIATTNKTMLAICKDCKNVSRLIDFMEEIGLIREYDNHYQFNANNAANNHSKRYAYFVENERQVIDYCKEHNIEKFKILNHKVEEIKKVSINEFDKSQVKFSSKLHIVKPEDFSVAQFENYLTMVLYENYPRLSYYQRLADEINEKYYSEYPELALRFVPSFTWQKGSKVIRKIGIRCTNTLVSAKKEKDENEAFKGFYKDDVLEQYGLNLDKDVKSSVPRITLSLNTGAWIPEDIDLYEMIFDEFSKENRPFTKEDRDVIKALFMRTYFDSINTLSRNTIRAMANCFDKNVVSNAMFDLKRAVETALGGTLYDSEIFFHESCIYLDVLEELLNLGYFTWICYDAFYSEKKGITQKEFEKLVLYIVEVKANAYIKSL